MAIPDYQTLMRLLLELANDGAPHRLSEATEQLAVQYRLTAEERAQLLPSGRQSAFANRVGWARTYLSKAGLLNNSQRGTFSITDRGRAALAEQVDRIDRRYLKRFPEFAAFIGAAEPAEDAAEGALAITPEEQLDRAHKSLMSALADELLERIRNNSPDYFESLVVKLLEQMGYGGGHIDAGEVVGKSGDGGIDGVIRQDVLGLDAVYVQAKRWQGTVPSSAVREFAGSLDGRSGTKGVLITTSGFSPDGLAFAEKISKNIVLIDGSMLAKLLIEHDVGVKTEVTYKVKRLDLDYLAER